MPTHPTAAFTTYTIPAEALVELIVVTAGGVTTKPAVIEPGNVTTMVAPEARVLAGFTVMLAPEPGPVTVLHVAVTVVVLSASL
jgi:hypothetical protein